MTFIEFWLAKIAVEILLAIAGAFLILTVAGIYILPSMLRQHLCKHDQGVRETQACDAICRKCGKNLGFIGTWRKKHSKLGTPTPATDAVTKAYIDAQSQKENDHG